jgi:phosphopantothenoylcysteine decarboxylase/phosphopantothenate--cysteine ligase
MSGKRTALLCVTGGIAAYKAAEVARELSRAGVTVRVAMTQAAQEFVSPLTFEALTHNPVATDVFDSGPAGPIPHITLATECDVIIVAPATADALARLAHGFADDIVCCTVLASDRPLIIAPAMHTGMWLHPATQANVATLTSRGACFVGPISGDLASGDKGIGRLAEIDHIVAETLRVLGRNGDLSGRRIVVTAGGTQEPIDPVRCVTNHSSGKMGYAVAEAARDRGADVTLVSAPTALREPAAISVVHVMTAQQMADATQKAVDGADALIMAAAVADFRPAMAANDKIKKKDGAPVLQMERTVDILGTVRGDFIRVGFAAESSHLRENADSKLREKNLDFIVANDITANDAGFGSDNNRVTILDREGGVDELPLLSKREVAERILDRVVRLLT